MSEPSVTSFEQPCTSVKPRLHRTVVIEGDVHLDEGVEVGAYTVLRGPLRLGTGCRIGSHCILGGEPEHLRFKASGELRIGDHTIVRDGCVIHHGTSIRGTQIGRHCYLMSRCYIAHDCHVEDHVIVSAGASVGGHSNLQLGANLGMNASVHQHTTIGAYSMIGMSTPIAKDIPPLCVVAGNPARLMRANHQPIQQLGLDMVLPVFNVNRLVYQLDDLTIQRWIEHFVKHSTREQLFSVNQPSETKRKPR